MTETTTSRLDEAKRTISKIVYADLAMVSNSETMIETGWRALSDGALTQPQRAALKSALITAETHGKTPAEFSLLVADIAHYYGLGLGTVMKKRVQRQRLITLSTELGNTLTMERV